MKLVRYGQGTVTTFYAVYCSYFIDAYSSRSDLIERALDLGLEWQVELRSDLRDSILDDATEICVTGVYIESFETLLERTLNALPPPSDNIAEAPSIIDKSSRYRERSDCSPSWNVG
jgi:hypothetical protein